MNRYLQNIVYPALKAAKVGAVLYIAGAASSPQNSNVPKPCELERRTELLYVPDNNDVANFNSKFHSCD